MMVRGTVVPNQPPVKAVTLPQIPGYPFLETQLYYAVKGSICARMAVGMLVVCFKLMLPFFDKNLP